MKPSSSFLLLFFSFFFLFKWWSLQLWEKIFFTQFFDSFLPRFLEGINWWRWMENVSFLFLPSVSSLLSLLFSFFYLLTSIKYFLLKNATKNRLVYRFRSEAERIWILSFSFFSYRLIFLSWNWRERELWERVVRESWYSWESGRTSFLKLLTRLIRFNFIRFYFNFLDPLSCLSFFFLQFLSPFFLDFLSLSFFFLSLFLWKKILSPFFLRFFPFFLVFLSLFFCEKFFLLIPRRFR